MNGFERSETLSERTVDLTIAAGVAMTLLPLAVVGAIVMASPGLALVPFAIRSARGSTEPERTSTEQSLTRR